MEAFGSPDKHFCRNSSLPCDKLCHTIPEDFEELELLEKIFGFLQIHHVTPLGFCNNLRPSTVSVKVFYVAGCWDAV